jgi:hypothetical protein
VKHVATCLALSSMLAFPAEARDRDFEWKLSNTTYSYHVGLSTPAACDARMLTGFAHWNGASRFNVTQSGRFFSGPINRGSPDIQIQMEPGERMESGAANLAEAPPGTFVRWTTIEGAQRQELRSAHVRINADKWATGQLFCGSGPVPPSAYDYAYVVAHEAGHVLGLGHGDPLLPQTCIMRAPLRSGVSLFARCLTETRRAQTLYGLP